MLNRHHPAALAALALLVVSSASSPARAQTPAPVDVCKLLTTTEAGEVLGTKIESSTPDAPRGSLLGGCTYLSMRGIITLSARPAAEYDASVRAMRDAQPADVGTGAKASYSDRIGLLMQQTGKPYFVQVVIAGTPGPKTSAPFVAVAKKVVAKG